MFKKEVLSRYEVVSSNKMLEDLVEDAEKVLLKIEEELKKAQQEFEDKLASDAPYQQLTALEDKIEELEKERNEAEAEYEKARQTTLDDLKAEKSYQDWKDSR